MWDTEEMLTLIEWMHTFNQPKQRMQFMGFDMQFYEGAVNELFLAFKGNEEVENKIAILEKELSEVVNRKQANIWSGHREDSLLLFLQNSIETTPFQSLEKEWLQQNIIIIRQYLKMELWDVNNWRDRCMADNFMWIKERNPNSKFIIWAHNGHIMKTPHKGASRTMMGNYLAQRLDRDYTNFGFTFFDGSFTADGCNGLQSSVAFEAYPGTLEYLLNQLNEPIFILDLKKIKVDKKEDTKWLLEQLDYRGIGGVAGNTNEFLRGREIANDFDYLIFIKTSSPSTLRSVADYTQTKYKGGTSDGFNLDFENVENGMPTDWLANGSGNYKFSSDSTTVKSGKYAVCIEHIDGMPQFGLFGLMIPKNYDGKQITLSGYVKTENVINGHASLLMRIDPDIGNNEVIIKETTDWTKYEITVKMNPEKTNNFAIAAMLLGKGKVWSDDLKIFIDGKDIHEISPIKSTNQIENKLK